MHCINCGKENEEGNQFCMYCGAELYKQEVASSEPVLKESPPLIQDKSVPSPEEKKLAKPDQRKLFVVLGATGVIVGALICMGIAFVLFGFQIFSPQEQLVYGIQENTQTNFTVIMTVTENGKDNKEIYSDNDGISSFAFLLDYIPWLKSNMFSPDGNTIALAENNGDLLLLDRDSSVPITVDTLNKGLAGVGFLQGFSPNGKYFGFTDEDDNSYITVIVDLQGNEIYSVEDRIFGGFLPDSERIVVLEMDRRNLTGLGILDILNGEYTYLTGVEESDLGFTTLFYGVTVSPNGDMIYYVDGTNLMRISVTGDSPSVVYESDTGIGYTFFSPDGRTLAILDQDGQSLYLYNTRRDERSRVANDVQGVAFSPNGKYLVYMTNEGTSENDLYLSNLDGSEKIRIAKNAGWFKYAFSPNNNYLAYIEGNSRDEGGSLYIVRRDGSDSTRLDTGVWSFRFIDNGNRIVYIKVSDLDQGNPESEMYRIRINGENREQILQADDGLFTFIWPVP